MHPFIPLCEAEPICKNIAQKAWRKLKRTSYIVDNKFSLGRLPKIYWKKLGFSVAGYAIGGKYVEMNINYLYSEDANEFLNQIIRHELAHIAEYRIFGKTNHGSRWKKFSSLLEYSGKRCHCYSDPINKRIRKLYCKHCGEVKVFLYRQEKYTCPLCNKEAKEKT